MSVASNSVFCGLCSHDECRQALSGWSPWDQASQLNQLRLIEPAGSHPLHLYTYSLWKLTGSRLAVPPRVEGWVRLNSAVGCAAHAQRCTSHWLSPSINRQQAPLNLLVELQAVCCEFYCRPIVLCCVVTDSSWRYSILESRMLQCMLPPDQYGL